MAPDVSRKTTLFDDSEDESEGGGVDLKVNDDFAKRFEHNKKREERHRLEEKYKGRMKAGDDEDDDTDSSEDETEDEDGFLATEELDAQISATLQAIRNKDPRVYDGKTTFYAPADQAAEGQPKTKKEKPVFLQDYHRERIMAGDTYADAEDEPPKTYTQEQNDLQKSIRDEIKAQLGGDAEEESDDDDGEDGFIKPKEGEVARAKAELSKNGDMHPSRAGRVKPLDVTEAEKDPQTFLSNFMASRAWVEPEKANWQAFESDEEEVDDKADEWEVAYNLRFEDPSKSNEVLKTYARDVAAAKSVRREEKTGRKRQRELEREQKEAGKQERREERARLRRLRVEDAQTKLNQIKKVAGLSGKTLKEEDWAKFLDDAWENDKWEEEMNKTFGDQYYAEGDDLLDEEGPSNDKNKKNVKKPKWDDDIDIKDLVPDFQDEERPDVSVSDLEVEPNEDDDEDEGGENADEDDEDEDDEDAGPAPKRQKTTKDRKKERLASQKEARQERAKIAALVDAKMDIEDPVALAGSSSQSKAPSRFAYRETWAESYGLTARDILMAPDAALNEYVGLKKLAHFRPADKKKKDKKRLGKKARLRQWRRETFGAEAEKDGPAFSFGSGLAEGKSDALEMESNIIEGGSKKRKKRSGRKGKGAA